MPQKYVCIRKVRTKADLVPYTALFKVGDKVEFYSGEHGGCWKSGIVEEWECFHPQLIDNNTQSMSKGVVRIRVGIGVWVIRKLDRVRHRIETNIANREVYYREVTYDQEDSNNLPVGRSPNKYDYLVPSPVPT